MSTPSHIRALAGLSAADLCRLARRERRGTSPPQPFFSYVKPSTQYFPKWTTEGHVCTFALQKPEYGNSRVIVDCAFDLNYAALCEVFQGRGSVMFCQMDVTNARYGYGPGRHAAGAEPAGLLCTAEQAQEKTDPFGPVYRVASDAVVEKLLAASRRKAVRRVWPAVQGRHAGAA